VAFTSRCRGAADQVWPPGRHNQNTLRSDRGLTSAGVSESLALGCHWAARSGATAARLVSGVSTHPSHSGHCGRRVRTSTVDCHSWPFPQRHHTRRLDPATTAVGASPPLRSGCHSAATSGCVAARLFSGLARRPTQNGHREPRRARASTRACQRCPTAQHHQTRRSEPSVTAAGSSPPLDSVSHSASRGGLVATVGRCPTSLTCQVRVQGGARDADRAGDESLGLSGGQHLPGHVEFVRRHDRRSATNPAARAGCRQTGHRAFPNEVPLERCQGGHDPEQQAPGQGRRIDCRGDQLQPSYPSPSSTGARSSIETGVSLHSTVWRVILGS
jgi:hypothetical protein